MLRENRRGVPYGGIDSSRTTAVELPLYEPTTKQTNGSGNGVTERGVSLSVVDAIASVINGANKGYDADTEHVVVEGGRVWRENLPPAVSSLLRLETGRPIFRSEEKPTDHPNYDIDSVYVGGGQVLRGGDNVYDPNHRYNYGNRRGHRYDARDDAFTEEDW